MSRFRAFGVYIMDEHNVEVGEVKVGKHPTLHESHKAMSAARERAATLVQWLNMDGRRAERAKRELWP